jgi:hypothetical protein
VWSANLRHLFVDSWVGCCEGLEGPDLAPKPKLRTEWMSRAIAGAASISGSSLAVRNLSLQNRK